jgi:TIR domain
MSAGGTHRKKFDAFLSHAHADKAAVDRLYAWLNDVAGVRVWYDALDLPPGSDIASFLPAAILDSRACIFLLSESSVRRGWVQKEYSLAVKSSG